jgi:hypothetical protein
MLYRILLAVLATCAAPPAPSVDSLIEDLGSDKFEARQRAESNLFKIGDPALPKLEAAKSDKDLERKSRAKRIYHKIYSNLFAKLAEQTRNTTVSISFGEEKTGRWARTSGVIIYSNKDASYILTCSNLFEQPDKFTIWYKDQEYSYCHLVKMDAEAGLALIRIYLANLPTAKLATTTPKGKICQSGCGGDKKPVLKIGEHVQATNLTKAYHNIEVAHGDAGAGLFHLENYKDMRMLGVIWGKTNNDETQITPVSKIKEFLKDVKQVK